MEFEDPLDDSVQGVRRWAAQARAWGRQRVHRYMPIHDRKDALLAQLGRDR